MTTITKAGGAYISYEPEFYVNGNLYDDSVLSYRFVEKLNQVPEFSVVILGAEEDARNNDLKVGNELYLVSGRQLLFPKMLIRRAEYKSFLELELRGYGVVESTLLNKLVEVTSSASSDSQAGRPLYENTAVNTIVTEQLGLVSDVNEGTNDVTKQITIRGENDNILSFLNGVAEVADAEWWGSYGDYPFTSNYFNMTSRRGSDKSATITLTLSGDNQNATQTERQVDYDFLVNYVKVFGYGDGINQLESHSFHATSVRTTLASDLSATETSSMTVEDASELPDSGSVWVGCEKISYTSKSGNILQNLTRGVAFLGKITEPYYHKAGSPVYDAQYTTTSPQSTGNGSSINSNGLKEKSFVDRTIIDQSALDILAEKILLERCGNPLSGYTPPERIKVKIADPTWGLRNIDVGDWVTVSDPDSGLNNKYRVYSKELTFENGLLELQLELGTGTQEITTEIKKATDAAVKLSQYMQGATNIFVVNETENAQSGKPIDIFFHIPEDAVAINSVKLSYRNEAPRIWSDVTLSGGSTTTSSGGGTVATTTTTTPSHTHDVPIGSHSHSVSGTTSSSPSTNTSGVQSNWSTDMTGASIASGSMTLSSANVWYQDSTSLGYSGSFGCLFFIINLEIDTSAQYYVRLYNSTEGVYYPNSSGLYTGYFDMGSRYTFLIIVPPSARGDNLYLQIKSNAGGKTVSYNVMTLVQSDHTHSLASHTHSISGQTALSKDLGTKTSEAGGGSHNHSVTIPDHTHTVPNHTHDLAYSIATKSYTTTDISIYTTNDASVSSPTWTDRTSSIESALGRALRASNGSVEEGIDLTEFFSGTGWKGVRIAPNGNSRHKAQVVVKCYVQSKT